MDRIKGSFLYNLDPRTKMLFLISFIFIGVMITDPFIIILLLIFIYFLYRISGISAKRVFNTTKPLILAFVLFFLLNFPFVTPIEGEKVYTYLLPGNRVPVTATGILTGIGNGLRFILFIWISDLITTMTPTDDIVLALNKANVPPEVSIAIGIAFSYIPVLKKEYSTIIEAQKSRGASFESKNIFKKISSYIPVIVPGLFISIVKGREISRAIEARGFTYDPLNRTYRREIKMKIEDFITIIFIITFLGLVIYLTKNRGMFKTRFIFDLLSK